MKLTIHTLTVDPPDGPSIITSVHPSEEDAWESLRERFFADDPDAPEDHDELLEYANGQQGYVIYFDEHEVEVPDPRVELLHDRDPDGYCSIKVWLNGNETRRYVEESIDPGAGHMLSDWREHTEWVEQQPYSPEFKAEVIATRTEAESSKYVEEDPTV